VTGSSGVKSLEWVRETPARWDAAKAGVLGELSTELFGLGRPAEGDALADEWWRVERDGEVLGYGRLDETWGDAEILLLVAAGCRRSGVGGFILARLEAEAAARQVNYVYNVVPQRHPDPESVTGFLTGHGFERTAVGELRKRVRAAERDTSALRS
jgi:N-acetylglutamate synthase-like GNAT family acetyltransferase